MDTPQTLLYVIANATSRDVTQQQQHDVMKSSPLLVSDDDQQQHQQRDDVSYASDDVCDENSTLHIILTSIYVTIAVFGILGNILSFVVLHWKSESHATNLLLKGLSVIDTLFLCFAVLHVSFVENSRHSQCDSFVTVVFGTLAVRYVMTIAQFVSVWVIVVLAFFRYEAICNPFRVKLWCNTRTARLSFVVISVVGLIIWAPFMLQFDVTLVVKHHSSSNSRDSVYSNVLTTIMYNDSDLDYQTFSVGNSNYTIVTDSSDVTEHAENSADGVYTAHNSQEMNDDVNDAAAAATATTRQCYKDTTREWAESQYYKIYDAFFAHIGSMFIVPFIALMVFNASMMKDLYCPQMPSPRRHRTSSASGGVIGGGGVVAGGGASRRTREIHEITKVVFAIVVVFLVSQSMYVFFILHTYTNEHVSSTCNENDLFIFSIRTVALLNSGVNFVIYYVLRTSFRRKVWRLVCSCCDKHRHGSRRGTYSTSRESRFISYNKTSTMRIFRFTRRHTSPEPQKNTSLNGVRGGQARRARYRSDNIT